MCKKYCKDSTRIHSKRYGLKFLESVRLATKTPGGLDYNNLYEVDAYILDNNYLKSKNKDYDRWNMGDLGMVYFKPVYKTTPEITKKEKE